LKRHGILIILTLFFVSEAAAQYSAQLSPAGTVMKGISKAGSYAGIYEGAFGVLGQFRYGVGGYSDFGMKAAIIDLKSNSPKGDIGFCAAVDYKYQVMEVRIADPIDLSLGAALEIVKFNHFSNLMLGGAVIGSYPVALKNGRSLIPYGRLIMGFDRSRQSDNDAKTEFNLALNMGATYELSPSTDAVAEFQFDSDVAAFLMGLTFGL